MCADSLNTLISSSHSVSCGVKSINDEKHAEKILNRLHDFCMVGKFTDFELTSYDCRHFKVHSVVLSAVSDFFHGILIKRENSYNFECADSATLELIIDFCYTGQIRLTPSNVEAVIVAAHELQIIQLKMICSQFHESTLDIDNCLRYALIAEKCELKSSKELAQKYFANNCSKICKLKENHHWNSFQFDEFIAKLLKNQNGLFDDLLQQILSSEYNSLLPEMFFKDLFKSIFRSFFIAGYVESMITDGSKLARRSTSPPVPKALIAKEINDKGLYIVAKTRSGNGIEIYSICDSDRSRINQTKCRINTDGMNMYTLKMYPNKDRIYVSYLNRNQRLEIKSWSFKTQTNTDILLHTTVQYLKPRLTNVVGDAFLVTEEKYVTWPYEGYKTTACKFGLRSESYKSIEFNYDTLKEIICIGDDVFAFSNQKADVVSFDLNTGKRTSRGALNHNGVVEAVVFHGKLYVGSYVRSKCTLFVEEFNKNNNQWTTIGSICTYSDALNYHIGATDHYLYVFYGNGKVQRYNEAIGRWKSLDLVDSFDQMILCVSSSPFTCIQDETF